MTPSAAALPPGEFVDSTRNLSFTFEGQTIPALAGQSLGAALYASGVRVFTRSFKYHRPRGLLCVAGECANCLMQVDGRPNVRTCVEPVRGGEVVEHQNAWPSLGFDALRFVDKLDRLFPVGFYYKRFHKPRWAWPLFERLLRRVAGLGRIDLDVIPDHEGELEHLHADVCVIGGGPAGLSAAMTAGDAGASVLLLEAQPRVGGHLLFDTLSKAGTEAFERIPSTHPRVEILLNTSAFGLYQHNLVAAFQGRRLLKIRAKQVIVCTGGRQQPFVFQQNDLPGIFLGRGAQRLARLHGVSPGQRAVIVTESAAGASMAEQFQQMGIEIAAVVDRAPARAGTVLSAELLSSSIILRARGNKRVKAVRVAAVGADGTPTGPEREIACDFVCMVPGLTPANELLRQAGVGYREEGGRWVVENPHRTIAAAGAVAGTADVVAQIVEGRLRGAAAAAALGYSVPQLADYQTAFAGSLATTVAGLVCPNPAGERKRFVCLCEDVTEKDIQQAVAEGFDHIETLKRYSTFGMGPCQGKSCSLAATQVCSRATGLDITRTGNTTSRPPAIPVELGTLATGNHHPVRRTPLHATHENAGVRWLDAGQWKRPESYGEPVIEVRAVRTGVGLIDVSTLGKLEIIGPDAGELLDRVYLNKWSDLVVGRIRYGVMCNEDGILFDDGVGVRIGPEQFYLSTTTGNAEAVLQWLEMWKATWRLKASILNHTASVAAMNLAGPNARELLGRVSTIDVSPAGFPHMSVKEGEVAKVTCRILRIGFVGEVGYEIHCSSAHAWHLWKALTETGLRHGLKPFGVEAQRILRLEKGHVIIGQDTDALSNPLEAGFEKLVRFDKPLFHGRETLLRFKERGQRNRLVGFFTDDKVLLPAEGCQVVENGKPVGRVTSCRFSPTLERGLGLAWLPVSAAAEGTRFLIRSNGKDLGAIVAALPFYDPKGERLKN